MGQCYTVIAKMVIDDGNRADFCRAVRSEIENKKDVFAFGDLKELNLDDPFDCFKALTTKTAEQNGDNYCAEFNNSYGWEYVMVSAFKTAVDTLRDGSFVTIYPDSGSITLKKGNTN